MTFGDRSGRRRLARTILVSGALVLVVWAFALVPRDFRGLPSTPFDRSDSSLAAAFRFLSAARPAVPVGASATVVAEPRDAARETSLYGAAVALLDARRVLPAAQWGAFTPNHELEAEYVLVYGAPPAVAPGDLVTAVPGGAVYRRARSRPPA